MATAPEHPPSATQSAARALGDHAASAAAAARPSYSCPECAAVMKSPNHTICPNCALPLDPTVVRAAFGVTSQRGGSVWVVWLVLAAGTAAGLVAAFAP